MAISDLELCNLLLTCSALAFARDIEHYMCAQQDAQIAGTTKPVVKATAGKINEYQGPKSKLNPKDFEFIGLRNEVRIKPPG